jgi:hypothetical protein
MAFASLDPTADADLAPAGSANSASSRAGASPLGPTDQGSRAEVIRDDIRTRLYEFVAGRVFDPDLCEEARYAYCLALQYLELRDEPGWWIDRRFRSPESLIGSVFRGIRIEPGR